MCFCTLLLSFACCPVLLGTEFAAKKLIFACLVRETAEKSKETLFSKLAGNSV